MTSHRFQAAPFTALGVNQRGNICPREFPELDKHNFRRGAAKE